MEGEVSSDQPNTDILEYKLTELNRTAFMELLVQISQKCFASCVVKVDSAALSSDEKVCLNACYNARLQARSQLMNLIMKDVE